MDAAAGISEMLATTAANLRMVQAAVQVDDNLWTVSLGEDTSVDLEMDEAGARLFLSVNLGKPDAEHFADIAANLMTYSRLASATGGGRMAMTGPKGDVVLMTDLYLPEVSELALATVITNLSQAAGAWRNFVATGEFLPGSPSDDPANMIRV